jgi:hypothetical protein
MEHCSARNPNDSSGAMLRAPGADDFCRDFIQGSNFKTCFISSWLLLLVAGFECTFDPLPGFPRQNLLWRMIVVAVLRGGSQKFYLFAVTQAPDAKRQVNPQPDPLQSWQRPVERVGLQADGLPAIGRKCAEDFGKPVHG